MKKSLLLLFLFVLLFWGCLSAQNRGMQERKKVPLDSIRLSDPFIMADAKTKMYYMTGTGGQLWKSSDLRLWDGPYHVTQTDPDSWMGERPAIWAAEIHEYNGKYYYFGTFTNNSIKIDTVKGNAIDRRACHVLVSEKPEGPYVPVGKENYCREDQPTLDATLWIEDGKPYMLYCHEWLQNWNGTVEAILLKPDLSGVIGNRKILFFASESPWSKDRIGETILPNKVTDGPYVFRTQTGKLGMIWTSWVHDVYTQGVAYSDNGRLDGNWIHEPEPITPPNFGHGMLFRTFEGKLMMCIHSHKNVNGRYIRVPRLFEVDDSGDKIAIKPDYQLVWSDEFDYEGLPNSSIWKHEEGFVRNNEFQWYQPANASVSNGILTITAKRESFPNPRYEEGSSDWRNNRKNVEYTSSCIRTIDSKRFLYGRFEFRAKIPTASGAWPAIWTLGESMPWPSSGEIDIMEYYQIKGVPHILANTAWGTDRPYNAKWNTKTFPFTKFTDKDPDWADKFHIWRMDWDKEAIRLYLDDELLNETLLKDTQNGSIGSYSNPFHQPHYILLNLAIGGNNGGIPDDNAFPLKYEIDYVRVYKNNAYQQ